MPKIQYPDFIKNLDFLDKPTSDVGQDIPELDMDIPNFLDTLDLNPPDQKVNFSPQTPTDLIQESSPREMPGDLTPESRLKLLQTTTQIKRLGKKQEKFTSKTGVLPFNPPGNWLVEVGKRLTDPIYDSLKSTSALSKKAIEEAGGTDPINMASGAVLDSVWDVLGEFQIPQQVFYAVAKRAQEGDGDIDALSKDLLEAVKGKGSIQAKNLFDKALDSLADNGVMSRLIVDGIKENPAYKAIGFVTDVSADPIMLFGVGAVTKFGRISRVVRNAMEMGDGIKLDSKAAEIITDLWKGKKISTKVVDLTDETPKITRIKREMTPVEKINFTMGKPQVGEVPFGPVKAPGVLADTLEGQLDLGQKALITVLGRPSFKGKAIYTAIDSLKDKAAATRLVKGILEMNSNRLGQEKLDEILDRTRNLLNFASEEGRSEGIEVGKRLKGADKEQTNLVSKILDKGLDYEVVHDPKLYGATLETQWTPIRRVEQVGKRSYTPIDASKPVSGVFFHGTQKGVPSIKLFDQGKMRVGSLYGPGMYLTDDISVASGYAKTTGPAPELGRILTAKVSGAKLIDVHKQIPKDVLKAFRYVIPDEFYHIPEGTTVENAIRKLQESGSGLPDYAVDEYFSDVYSQLKESGYDGFLVRGGGRVDPGSKSHNVLVLFPDQRYTLKGKPGIFGSSLEQLVSPSSREFIPSKKIPTRVGWMGFPKQTRISVGVPQEISTVVRDVRNVFQADRDAEITLGVLDSQIEYYFPRILTKEGQRYIAKHGPVEISGFNILPRGVKLQASKERKTGEFFLEEYNDMMRKEKGVEEFFTTDPAVAVAIRHTGSLRARTIAEMWDDVVDKFAIREGQTGFEKAVEIKGISRLRNPRGVGETIGKGIRFDPEIARHIQRMNTILADPVEMGYVMSRWNRLTDYWKSITLGVFPEYHFRNMVTNFWNNYLSGVTNPRRYYDGMKIIKGTGGLVKSITGKEYTFDQVRKLGKKLGIEGSGLYGADVTEEIKRVSSGEDFRTLGSALKTTFLSAPQGPDIVSRTAQKAQKVLNPFTRDNQIIRLGFVVGKSLENNARMAHFLDRLIKGDTPIQAAQSVAKYLFDYTDLTRFEKSIKPFLPFMKWTKQNIPVQVASLFRTPWKFTMVNKGRASFFEEGEVMQNPYPQVADFIRENTPVRTRTLDNGKHEYFLLGYWWPAADLQKLLGYDNAVGAVSNLLNPFLPSVKMARKILEWSSPSAAKEFDMEQKRPLQFIGKFFSRNTVNKLRTIRALTTIDRFMKTSRQLEAEQDQGLQPTNPWLKFITGLRTYQTNPAMDVLRQRKQKVEEMSRQLRDMQKMSEMQSAQ